MIGNKVQNVNALNNLSNLVYLDLTKNKVQDIYPLRNLTNLRVLHLDICESVIDLAPLGSLIELRQLFLKQNCLCDISPLSRLSKLKELRLVAHVKYLTITDKEKSSGGGQARDGTRI